MCKQILVSLVVVYTGRNYLSVPALADHKAKI